jgi:glycosyltransferase involved in cell wall biosynthesis
VRLLQFFPFVKKNLVCLYPRLSFCNVLFVHDFIDEKRSNKTAGVYVRIFVKIVSMLMSQKLIFISKHTHNDFCIIYSRLANFILNKKPWIILHNVTDEKFYTIENRPYPDTSVIKLVFYGAWKEYKNFEYGLKALPPIENLHLTIIGDDLQCGDCARKVSSERGLNWNVETKNACSNEDLARIIDDHHGVFYPSLMEGFGMPLLESALRKRWIIVNPLLQVAREVDYGNQVPLSVSRGELLVRMREAPDDMGDFPVIQSPHEWCISVGNFSK